MEKLHYVKKQKEIHGNGCLIKRVLSLTMQKIWNVNFAVNLLIRKDKTMPNFNRLVKTNDRMLTQIPASTLVDIDKTDTEGFKSNGRLIAEIRRGGEFSEKAIFLNLAAFTFTIGYDNEDRLVLVPMNRKG